jgi:hypothetical protein
MTVRKLSPNNNVGSNSKLSTEDQSSLTLRVTKSPDLDDKYNLAMQRNAPFGSSMARFDPAYDCKLLFDRSPGPGSYNTTKDKHDFSDLSDLDTDTLISLNELKAKLNVDTSNLDTISLKEKIA